MIDNKKYFEELDVIEYRRMNEITSLVKKFREEVIVPFCSKNDLMFDYNGEQSFIHSKVFETGDDDACAEDEALVEKLFEKEIFVINDFLNHEYDYESWLGSVLSNIIYLENCEKLK